MDSSSSRSAASGATPTVSSGAVFISAAIFLLFLTFALALLILRHTYFSSTSAAPSGRRPAWGAQMVAPPPRGVDPELLRSLPVTVHRAADGVGLVECAVCLAELENGEEARFLPRCGHGFHAGCVNRWLASHTTCPLCRVTVGKPDALTSTTSLAPVPPEPANYAANLPASVLLGVSDQATLGALTMATDGVLVIDVPEPRMVAAISRDASKSPGVNRLRSVKRLWSFGRQVPSGYTTPCAGCSGTADVEQGISITYASPRAPVRCSVDTWSG
ncbi:hypothetical protein CFC21_039072 [Triticum aestivum]|uniref:RING-type domain-containing protein n=2 Tax=Triticum aestivum TaxID=4565 RepID=A0A9R1FFM8_WHEAT|nr:E3 ubiquitin-protein ligase EL5-like [Triticum aestivum]KAF7027002.1 hypothetical protein CFC21_039072 [Triticum aestivum]CDM80453.1 unnamed protein product [Triticum aestivum]